MKSRLLLVAALALSGCAGGAATVPKSAPRPDAAVEVVEVGEADLGVVIEKLLAEVEMPNRIGVLAGAVRGQLERAARLFTAGHEAAGAASLDGAFFLIRGGEFRIEMIKGQDPALLAAANAAANAGNEGRALALYSMLDLIAQPGPLRDDVRGHLSALAEWRQGTIQRGGVQALGAWQRATLPQVLYRPNVESYRAAREATLRWLDAARQLYADRRLPPRSYEELEEREESALARQIGVHALAALALRYGDGKGLLTTLEDPSVASSVQPKFAELLQLAIEDGDLDAWLALWEEMDAFSHQGSELGELARAASFRIGMELYHADASIGTAVPFASLLMDHGMADAIPLVFARAMGQQTDARALSWALRMTSQALAGLDAIDDLQTARQTYGNAKSLLAAAQKAPRDVQRSLATLEHVMGAMEVRAGELERARPHLANSVRIEPALETLRLLAAVDRQQGKQEQALGSLQQMIELGAKQPLALAEAQLLHYDLLRSSDVPTARAEADQALEQALRAVLKARSRAGASGTLADGERVLARVLELYGDARGARRASERAFEAARNDPGALGGLLLDTARRALTLGDASTARQATRHLLDEDLQDDEIAYAAVWLFLLEQQLKQKPDGSVQEALARTARGRGWPNALSSWALRRMSNEELMARAHTRVEKVEARFYITMSLWVQGDHKAAREGLQQVAQGEAVELIEVAIARDLLATLAGRKPPRLPSDVEVP